MDSRSISCLSLVCCFVALAYCTSLSAQAQQHLSSAQTAQKPFVLKRPLRLLKLGTPTITAPVTIEPREGHRSVYELTIDAPGRLAIRANWPSTVRLALILNGPGQKGYYDRKDGRSPLSINFNVTPAHVQKGTRWRVSLVNFRGRGPRTRGKLSVTLPRSAARPDSPSTIVARTIQPDGSVLVEYADGTKKRMFDGGFEIIPPDGPVQRYSFMDVQGAALPDFPTHGQTALWLQKHNDQLLDVIRLLVGGDEPAVQHYLTHEGSRRPLYEKINKRTRAIQRLTSTR